MNPLKAFAPDYNRIDVEELIEHDQHELLAVKYDVAHKLHDEEMFTPLPRAAYMTQLISLLNLEIPQFAHVVFGLDIDSAVLFGVSLIDSITHATTEFALSWVRELDVAQELPRNRGCAIYSADYLSWLINSVSGELMFKAVQHADRSKPRDPLQHLDMVTAYLTAEAKEAFAEFTGSVYATPTLARATRAVINLRNLPQ